MTSIPSEGSTRRASGVRFPDMNTYTINNKQTNKYIYIYIYTYVYIYIHTHVCGDKHSTHV